MKHFEEDFQIFDTKAAGEPVSIPSTYNDRTRMVYQAARCGLRDFFVKNGYKKACIGLSGGIDSAVVACLAADALGRQNIRALLLPSQFSSDHSVEDAKKLAENLGIEYNVIPITEIYTSVVNTLKPVIGGREFDATEENIQTRIRTVLLMAVQNKADYILLNSSNKSENALGLCTLYGDTGGRFQPYGRPLQERDVRPGTLHQPHAGRPDPGQYPRQGTLVGVAPGAEGQRHPAAVRGGGRDPLPHD